MPIQETKIIPPSQNDANLNVLIAAPEDRNGNDKAQSGQLENNINPDKEGNISR